MTPPSQVRDVAYSTLTHAQRSKLHALLALRLTKELRNLDHKLSRFHHRERRRPSTQSSYTPQSPKLTMNQVLFRPLTAEEASAQGISVREMEMSAFRRRMARRSILVQVIAQHWRLAGEPRRAHTVQLLLRGDYPRDNLE